jgi:multicomponent Na+:H+ antiporter subunit B
MILRSALFAASSAALVPLVLVLARHMPEFGAHKLPYGDAVNAAAPALRHVANAVTAVNFDLRGFDTLGEEFMLLCAVTGATVLLRGARGERPSARPGVAGRPIRPRSDAAVLACRLVHPLLLLFGLYVALHATATPGGGFQGGVIAASATLLAWIAEGYRAWRRLMHSRILDAMEGLGAASFAFAGLIPVAMGAPYLANTLPLGQFKDVFAGGLMQLVNAGVTCAVAGGFGVLFLEFMEETRDA